MANVSTLTLQLQTLRYVSDTQLSLQDLQRQLSSGKKAADLTELGASNTRRLLDLRNGTSMLESYSLAINTVRPRVDLQGKALEELQKIGQEVLRSMTAAPNHETAIDQGLDSQLEDFMRQIKYYLNEKVEDRYIFAGARYTTQPMDDIDALAVPPTEAYPFVAVASPNLPLYDSQSPATSAAAYTENSVQVDEGFSVNYGVTSVDPALQKFILGIRWAYAATQDASNYDTYIQRANTLLTESTEEVRGLEATTAAAGALLQKTLINHNETTSLYKTQVADIEVADQAEVATGISILSAQLQASYAATARLLQLSITNYL